MEDIRYIMVTSWGGHWDQLEKRWNNSTVFTLPMIREEINIKSLPTEATTLFIKIDKETNSKKCWIGKSKSFRPEVYNGKDAIRFDVSDLREVDCPKEFNTYINGWHLNKVTAPKEDCFVVNNIPENLQLPFFREMAICSWEIFEQHCYHLFRVIGIHDIHTLPRESQQGKADGFFRFHTLAVIYDATIATNYNQLKEQQIENYINQLKKDKFQSKTHSYTITEAEKQVWIITRGAQVKNLGTKDHIIVKEIPYKKLIEVYNQRLIKECNTIELLNILKDLE